MKTIETELRKYRMCRAEMERGCDGRCGGCNLDLVGSIFHRLAEIDAILNGEALA